jgi:hypothetical protein
VVPVLGREVVAVGRAYPVLRETLMAAVVCEFAAEGDADAFAAIVRHSGDLARAVVQGIRRAFEPLDAALPITAESPGSLLQQ